jgi:hypothetical protein
MFIIKQRNTHSFCKSCHDKQVAGNYLSRKTKSEFAVCGGASVCPLGVSHPHVEECFLSCSLCSSMKGFLMFLKKKDL